ncbi:MAG: hypothetical protein H6603_08275 [Flavobacteriales bacterium]|nr:hypothetical protein [Flavobacteriales bacterium]
MFVIKSICSFYTFILVTVSACLYGVIAYFGLLFYEEGTDVYFKLVSNGFYTGVPDLFHNDGVLRYHAYLLRLLYEEIPGIEWYDVTTLFNLWLATCLFFVVLVLLGELFEKRVVIPAVVLSAIFVDSVLLIQITRFSIIISGLSISILLILTYSESLTKKSLLILSGLILYGVLLRADTTVVLITALIVPVGVLARENPTQFKHFFKRFKYTAFLVTSVFVVLFYSYTLKLNGVDRAYDSIRPYTFTLWDYERDLETSRLSDYDAAVIEAVRRKFLDDERVINESFFKRVGVIPLDKSPSFFSKYLAQVIPTISRFLNGYHEMLNRFLIPLIILIIVPFLMFKLNWRLFALQFWFVIVYMVITVFLKPELRVLSPLVMIFLLFECIILGAKTNRSSLEVLALTVITVISLSTSWLMYRENQSRYSRASEMLMGLSEVINTNTIVSTLGSGEFFDSRLSLKAQTLFDSYSLHNGLVYLYSSYKNRMLALTGGECFIDHLLYCSNNSQCLFLSNHARLETLENYMSKVYGMPCSFTDVSNEFGVTTTDGFGLFKLVDCEGN